jgi:hypothetical protein
MEYEASIGLVTEKIIEDFHVSTFYGEKHDLSDKKISTSHAPLVAFAKICTTPTASPLQAKKLKF